MAGGYAIDHFLGYTSRAHEDIDIIIKRKDQFVLQYQLYGFMLYKANKTSSLWKSKKWIERPVDDIWIKEYPDGPFRFQIMLLKTKWTILYLQNGMIESMEIWMTSV